LAGVLAGVSAGPQPEGRPCLSQEKEPASLSREKNGAGNWKLFGPRGLFCWGNPLSRPPPPRPGSLSFMAIVQGPLFGSGLCLGDSPLDRRENADGRQNAIRGRRQRVPEGPRPKPASQQWLGCRRPGFPDQSRGPHGGACFRPAPGKGRFSALAVIWPTALRRRNVPASRRGKIARRPDLPGRASATWAGGRGGFGGLLVAGNDPGHGATGGKKYLEEPKGGLR